MNDDFLILLKNLQIPAWVFLILWALRTIYVDVLKEHIQKRLNLKIEIQKKNEQTAKFNEEAAYKSKIENSLLDISMTISSLSLAIKRLNEEESNVLSLNVAEFILVENLEYSKFQILSEIRRIFEINNRMNSERQKNIKMTLNNYIDSLINESRNNLCKLFYNGNSLASFFNTISEEHKQIFRENLFLEIFSNTNDEKAFRNTQTLVINYFRTHIVDAKNFLSKM